MKLLSSMFKRYCFFIQKLGPMVAVVLCFGLQSAGAVATPKVVVSIPPIHSLVSSVMQGVGKPYLLIPGGQSPHANSLKPSALRELSRADLVVWVSPDFEISLRKAITLQQNTQLITLVDIPQMHVLSARLSGFRDTGHDNHQPAHLPFIERKNDTFPDFHLWLSPENAIEIVRAVGNTLREIDAENSLNYQRNTHQLIEKIQNTRIILKETLLSVKAEPYLVFHDAYSYFEQAFDLDPVGAVTSSPEKKPGLKTLLAIKQYINERDIKCIFHEPQFEPRLVTRIAEETGIRTGELDPIGAEIVPGPDLWFELMYSLRDNLLRCIQYPSGS
jgi:zinc transport system substrate-binding protein